VEAYDKLADLDKDPVARRFFRLAIQNAKTFVFLQGT
jgi:hypothetical protein